MSPLAPDLVLHGGRISTMDGDGAEGGRVVEALAARDGRIVAIGPDAEVLALAGPETKTVDLAGARAIPGIVESHAHPDSYAARIGSWEDVSPANIGSREALLDRIAAAASRKGKDDWVVCYRFDDRKSGGYPTLAEMDAAADGRPLYIQRTDGHVGLANTRAFTEVGLGTNPADPPFGAFDRDREGRLTGRCRETAAHVFLSHVHAGDTEEMLADGLERVFAEWRALGITTVYNSLCGSRSIAAYQRLRAEGRLGMRVGIIVSGREDGLVESFVASGIRSGFGDDWVRVIGVEWCPDCSTSGRTAAYYTPYLGEPVPGEPVNNTGMLLYDADDLAARAVAAHKAGLQVMIEGVGDRGIDFALDAIEACLEAEPRADHRMRVEHCCYVTPPILERLKRLGVVDSSATGFMHDLGDAYIAHRGQGAMQHMWPHRTLIDAGVPAPGHSDAMVCQANPFVALWSMVTRLTDTGGDLDAREAVSRTEALAAYTTLGAFSGREEAIKGALRPGMLADLAVLDRDYFSIPASEIKDVRVTATVLGGVYLDHTQPAAE
ncbi:MAG: amidohydrolase [Pseudomonadota bacterium]